MRERERMTETDIQRQTYRQAGRQTDRDTDIQSYRQTETDGQLRLQFLCRQSSCGRTNCRRMIN